MISRAKPLFSALLTMGASAALISACGTSADITPLSGTNDSGRLAEPLRPNASCPVVIETPEPVEGKHVPEGSPVTYNSSPPSGGNHYPVWANFQEYAQPIAHGYLVHSLEHGAVALLYKCTAGTPACDADVAKLRQIRDSIATDAKCDPSIRVRVIIAPDPSLRGPIAAAAWGWIYNAECVDVPTLTSFVRDRYAKAPEDFCTPGRVF